LFCVPHAGSGASAFARWWEHLPPTVDYGVVQLPGRETRLREAPATDLLPLASELADELAPLCDRPFALYGHSMGSVIAFEVARQMRRKGRPMPAHLFVSGHRPPQAARRVSGFLGLNDADFLEQLQRLYGKIPDVILAEPALMTLYVSVLRSDLALLEAYEYAPGPPLSCGLTVLGAAGDPAADASECQAWGAQTTGLFRVEMFPGDHFFIKSQTAAVLAAITADLAPALLLSAPMSP
jgi:medium-chain acyl-[acyl-carrier-protein] hydrolase